VQKLDKNFVSLQEVNTIQQNKTHLRTKEAKLENISKHANVNVPANYKSNDLILKQLTFVTIDLKKLIYFFLSLYIYIYIVHGVK
jgi:hypothetical protein